MQEACQTGIACIRWPASRSTIRVLLDITSCWCSARNMVQFNHLHAQCFAFWLVSSSTTKHAHFRSQSRMCVCEFSSRSDLYAFAVASTSWTQCDPKTLRQVFNAMISAHDWFAPTHERRVHDSGSPQQDRDAASDDVPRLLVAGALTRHRKYVQAITKLSFTRHGYSRYHTGPSAVCASGSHTSF